MDYFKPLKYLRIWKVPKQRAADTGARARAVRMYCEQANSAWALQLRAPISLGSSGYGREGKDFIIAHASLDRETMVEIRDTIDRLLTEGS